MKRKIFAPTVTRPKDPTTRLLQSFVMGYIKAKEIDESPIGPAEEEFVKSFIKDSSNFAKSYKSTKTATRTKRVRSHTEGKEKRRHGLQRCPLVAFLRK